MISVSLSFKEILHHLNWNPGKRGRTYCKLHGGRNPYSFSYNEETGLFHCFSCDARGDKIKLLMLALDVGFKEALGWFGLDGNLPVKSINNTANQGQHINLAQGLDRWARITAKTYRDDFRTRERIESSGFKRLRVNPEDELGLKLLEIAFKGKPQVEYFLDLLEGNQSDKFQAYKLLEGAE